MNGSTLISGENTAGKSTILDAIQLVLTTNTRKFNTAANEKGNRDLRGYVRCKIGNVGETYLRSNAVIANVALEFYEEKTEKYFVLGVHMTSPDEESAVITKWYIEECRLEALSFLNGSKPSLQDEFRINNRKIRFIDQKNAAKDRFKRRMGNLEDRFFDILPKSLAFKPMDNVKDFINKFVLSEARIDVDSLRLNIETLSELEELIHKSNEKLSLLCNIVDRYHGIQEKEKDILINELLLEMAQIEYLATEVSRIQTEIRKQEQYIEINEQQQNELTGRLEEIDNRLIELKVAMKNNEAGQLAENAKRKLEDLEQKVSIQKEQENKLQSSLSNVENLLRILGSQNIHLVSKQEFELLRKPVDRKDKVNVFEKLSSEQRIQLEEIRKKHARINLNMEELSDEITELQHKLRELENRNLQYPWYTNSLKTAIESEFKKRGIESKVYIVAELLEVTDAKWQNAVEGYFNTQKFNLIVEPGYYDIALQVYQKNQERIHTAGIVNTKKINIQHDVDNTSLAYVVHSDNRFAKAYANYVLGRVTRCDTVEELENYKIAITPEGMLYQGYVARNLDKETYKNPYIGQNAYRVQIVNVKRELEEKTSERKQYREEKQIYSDILATDRKVNLDLMATYMDAPYLLEQYKAQIVNVKQELKEANNDPTYLELSMRVEEIERERKEKDTMRVEISKEIGRLKSSKEHLEEDLGGKNRELRLSQEKHQQKSDDNIMCKSIAEEKYGMNRKTKTAKMIVENFSPQRTQYINEKDELLNGNGGLKELQDAFNHKFEQDFLRGLEGIRDYINAKAQLEAVELVRFEEQMKKAKEDCEEVFKSDFLARMKENIENARTEFKSLNKALQNIYYGDDSYHFLITFDKKKESLYRMITSENNQEGYNLWTEAFETEYKEEMDELFAKLVTKDDKGEKIIEEYTDYRSYLDYDIEIHKKNGTVQRFSDIYGEKSGSETQVPYYVAIAASFYQLYRLGNSVRIMLLDEAFDKMDDERIGSMLDFFNSLDLQVLMATPPAKIEIIGEKVDTILTAIRVGTQSIVEEYDL
jgi:uncharacterized protein YPO0396